MPVLFAEHTTASKAADFYYFYGEEPGPVCVLDHWACSPSSSVSRITKRKPFSKAKHEVKLWCEMMWSCPTAPGHLTRSRFGSHCLALSTISVWNGFLIFMPQTLSRVCSLYMRRINFHSFFFLLQPTCKCISLLYDEAAGSDKEHVPVW